MPVLRWSPFWGVEGILVKGIGWGAADIANIVIAALYAVVVFGLIKKIQVLAYLGVILPLVHVGFNFNIIMMVLNGFVLYFTINAARAIPLIETLPSRDDLEKENATG